ncbi:TonB-dependent receptor [Ferrimonas gelatinilytica]|uniref:TonB-dependent receptor n=1 Tax=Ferrimonas gelatinilytica TaxID=1255257 RepID=A0ABP9RTY7_9GAMM
MWFKPSALTLALCAAGLSTAVSAAEPEAQQEGAKESLENVETISVRGIRRSLALSQAEKMENTSVVEAISAEDIGKLPDSSIAESIARLPGLTSQRLDGRSNVVSVRGLSPDFTTATLNGREQVTTGDNRGVEFDQYPSELMSGVVVYKTPDASVMAQAVGGTIDMQTIRPLDHGETSFNVSARGEYNDMGELNSDVSDSGYRFSVSYIDQFLDDTLGLSIGFAKMSSPNQEERTHIWGYPSDPKVGPPPAEGEEWETAPGAVMGGYKPYVRSSELERDSVMATLQFQPNDRINTVFDLFYSEFNDAQMLRGIELPLAWGGGVYLDPDYTLEDGLITEGTFHNVKGLVRNDYTETDASNLSLGWNLDYAVGDNWTINTDIAYSRAKRTFFALETYGGTGRGLANGAKDSLGFRMTDSGAVFSHLLDYSDPNLILLGAPQNWGDPEGNGRWDSQDGFLNNPDIEDELTSFRLEGERLFDSGAFSAIQFGVNYSEREKSKEDKGYFLTLNSYGQPGFEMGQQIPQQYLRGNASLDFIGLGNLIAWDPMALLNDGFYNVRDAASVEAWRAVNNWAVKEQVTTLYTKLDIDTEVGYRRLTGNVGVQLVHTDQSSDGNAVTVNPDGGLEVMPSSGGTDYWEVLPSANLGLEVADDQMLRFAVARTLARPRMDQMNAGLEIGFDKDKENSGDLDNSPWSGSGGNAELKPWMAWQFDLSYENYFSDQGYFAVAGYYKYLENYIYQQGKLHDFSDVMIPGYDPVLDQGFITTPQNGDGGHIWGFELSGSFGFGEWVPALDGFGTMLSYSYADSRVKEDSDSDPIQLPGLSKDVVNATVYYEKFGFQARTSVRYRSEFLGEVSSTTLQRDKRYVQAETIVDAQLAYDFSELGVEGLVILLQGNNLTDEPFVTYEGPDSRYIKDHQSYGRNFMLGFSYSF